MKRTALVHASVLWAVVAACGAAPAGAAPWDKLLSFKRVEAEPGKVYRLSEENGPWMIMACSFSGDGAEQQAVDLSLELRKKYKLEAYVQAMNFNVGETFGRGLNQFGGQVKMKPKRGTEVHEIGVLVGNYRSVDDDEAQQTLAKLKHLQPECLSLKDGKKTNASLAGLRVIQQELLPDGSDKKTKGPMGHAFVTTNPLLPQDFFNNRGLDDFVVRLNEHIEHDLLNCPGRYTVQVAHFTGKVILDQKEIGAVNSGRKDMQSRLDEAAEKAHLMAEALRHKGVEAYEFHDRAASLVTVGSFDSVGTPRADGKIEIDPRVHAIITTYSAQPGAGGALQPRTVAIGKKTIAFDLQALPVEVPKRGVLAKR